MVGPDIAIAFAAFIALGELARITLPGGRDAAPIATAGALAYVLLITFDRAPVEHGSLQVVAVVAVAMLVGVFPHVVAGRAPSTDTMARRLLAIGFAAAAFRATGLDAVVRDLEGFAQAIIMVGIVAASGAVDAVLAAAVRAGTDRAPFFAVL